jgi:hypothetical protein
MQPIMKLMRLSAALLFLVQLTAAGCSATGAERAERLDPPLAEAGFHTVPANTTDRREALSSLVPLKLHYFEYKGKLLFWFSDPYVCQCVYTGDEADYVRLRQLKHERAEYLEEETAQQKYLEFMSVPVNQVYLGN